MKCLAHYLALISMVSLPAVADSYDAPKNQLTIDSVTVDGVVYHNVVVTLGSVVSLGTQSPASGSQRVSCQSSNFSVGVAQSIKEGMTLDQVDSLIGCAYQATPFYNTANANSYTWAIGTFSPSYSGPNISVYIDPTTGKVAPMFGSGGGFYATWSGF